MPSAVNKGEHIFLLKFCWNQVTQAPTFVESPRQTEHFVVKTVFLGISGFLKGRGWGELQENHSSKKSFTWQFLVTFSGWLSDPFKRLSDLQQGDEKVTLNHLAEVELIPLYNTKILPSPTQVHRFIILAILSIFELSLNFTWTVPPNTFAIDFVQIRVPHIVNGARFWT